MDIQLWVVILILCLSVYYLIKRYTQQLQGKKKAGCEKCGEIGEKSILAEKKG